MYKRQVQTDGKLYPFPVKTDELVMYDKVGVIANRLPNLDVKQYMDAVSYTHLAMGYDYDGAINLLKSVSLIKE